MGAPSTSSSHPSVAQHRQQLRGGGGQRQPRARSRPPRCPSRPRAAQQQHLFTTVRLADGIACAWCQAGLERSPFIRSGDWQVSGRGSKRRFSCTSFWRGRLSRRCKSMSDLSRGWCFLCGTSFSCTVTGTGARHTDARTFHADQCCTGAVRCASARSPPSDPGGRFAVHP